MSDWLQWAIVAFIVFVLGRHIWKGGAANPESTGELGGKVNGLSGEVKTLSGRLVHVEEDMKELKLDRATNKDIERIEERINTVRAEIEGHRALSQATNDSVRRIESIMLKKGYESK